MAPPTLLKTSYLDLESYGIDVSDATPPLPPEPPPSIRVQLVSASVTLEPPLPEMPSLIGASVSLVIPPTSPIITDMTLEVNP